MMMMMIKFAAVNALLLLLLPNVANSQFNCAFSGATDETSCFAAQAKDGTDCVWCAVSTFGFCVTESQAEAIEKSMPTAECDRKKDHNTTDDDDSTQDDGIAPTDDAIPDDFWNCLQQKDKKACHGPGLNCTWCDTKGHFGLCMSGPAAESASKSHWFKCDNNNEDVVVADPIKDPLDPACLEAFLQDQTKEACEAAKDADGNACEFCNAQGFEICLNADQAAIAEQTGATCDEKVQDPLDPACLMAYLEDQSKEGCLAAQDADGNACEFCSLEGAFDVCVNADQAAIVEQAGATCGDTTNVVETNLADPLDTSCMLEYLQDQTKEACLATTDQDGGACEFCNMQGFDICLNEDQAQIAKQAGATCDTSSTLVKKDMYDASCVKAFLQDQTKQGCEAAVDEDGVPCEFCHLEGVTDICLTENQANMISQLGDWCDGSSSSNIAEEEQSAVSSTLR